MLTMFSMSALADNNKNYSSKITAKAVGEGKVYVSYKNQASSPQYATESYAEGADDQKDAPTHTYYLYALANSGHEFAGWYENQDGTGTAVSTNTTCSVTITAAVNTATKTYYARFKPFFNFSATANKIYDHGTVTATVANSKIVGAVGDTQKSTNATFTAKPYTGCTFEGWYYDEKHTRLASTSTTYTTSITNNTAGSTAKLTLYAWFKSNQTLTWTYPDLVNIVNGTTETGAAAATASSNLTVTYESNRTDIATVNSSGDVTGVSASATAVTITATQAGNDEYNPVSATRQFYVVNKIEATFTPSGFSVSDLITLYVDATPTITLTGVDTDFTCISSNDEVVSLVKNGNVITLTAHKVGTADVTLTQPNNTTHSAVSTTYHFTVEKVSNTLAVSLAAQSTQVEGTIAVTFAGKNNTGTPIVGVITNPVLSSSVNNGSDVITYTDGVITAKNAGTAKITFIQATTDKYTDFTSSTYEITVTKISNPIIISLAGGSSTNIKLKYGATATLSYTYANTTGAAPTVTRTSGSYTTYSSGTITAGNAQGTDIYEIRQAETYKYEAGYNSFTIRVNNSDEKDGYVLYDDDEHGWSTISSYTPAALSGPGDNLSYEAFRWWGGVNQFYVMVSKNNGSSWEQYDNPNLPTSYQSYPTNKLPDGVTNVKFETRTGATSEKRVKNIFVTRKTYVTASSNKTNLGTVYTDASPKPTATITVNYSSTNGGNINISSNNSHFVPSISSISVESEKKATSKKGTTYICGVDNVGNPQTFTVTYTPDPNQLGAESAIITIGDLFNSQQITLTATAAKHDNTLAVIGTQDLKVDDVVSNVYSSKNSNAPLNYTLSREGVITYNPSTNKITAVGAGTAILTLTQTANDYYHSISKSVTVNVSKYDQTLTWDTDLADLTLEYGDVLTTNTATASTGMTVTYSSSNTDVLTVDATTGRLEAVGGGSSVITATQAGNNKISAVSITRRFTVFKRDIATVTTSLSESGTNLFPLGGDAITIRANATITENSFTITGNSEGYVSASFANNTLTISALKEGGPVTVTLTRDQDELYYAIAKSYTILVVKPALALNPASTPVIDYEKYSSVTLHRTLKAGYSTIALPFNTNVEELTGRADADDWVAQLSAVTNSVADGYTLYFQKVAGGTITANQPYVLHLGYDVKDPTWTDTTNGITVATASAASVTPSTGYSGYAGWTMYANYATNFPMEGKYGIVNSEGGLMLGGNGSVLNAFTAYIAGPAPSPAGAPRLRVAYVDEDGTATFIGSLPQDGEQGEPVAVYGPDGQRRNGLQRGVNIVRYADGTTRKVQY